MSDAGRKRWWRAATIAVLGSGLIVGGWAGLSRSAPPTSAEAAWSAAPPAVEPGEDKDTSTPAVPVVPAAAQLPALPAIPVIPPPDITPVAAPPSAPALPVIPAASPVLPPLPSAPAKQPEPTIPPIVPVVLPPTLDTSAPATNEQPKLPSPTNPARPDQLPEPAKLDSRLQDANVGNTVITDKPAASPKRSEPSAFPALDMTIPVLPPPGASPVAPASPPVRKPDDVPGIPVDRVKPDSTTPNRSEKDVFPIPNLTAPTPGDTTVKSLNQSVAAAILGGVLFAQNSPAPAAPLTIPLPNRIAADDKTDIAELKTKVEAATTKLTDIQKDLKQLTELLNGRRDKDGIPDGTSRGLVADIKDITDRLKKVEEDLTKMRAQSSSLRPSAPTGSVDPKPAKGIVRIVNEYPIQVSLVVNGTSYQVAPSKSLDVEVPTGEFTYQLLQSGAAATKSAIKEKETVTLRIK